MRARLPAPARDERGFVLVGVVTFMLALTILGLSLFALSSYEAQFFYASESREQSLQGSESGMELVKALLDVPNAMLDFAHRAEGQYGVTHAMAYQQRSAVVTDTTSSGLVDWASPIVIVVTARSGGVERTLQAKFTPEPADNPYKRLIACGGALTVSQANSTDPSTLIMTGPVWQTVRSAADTLWARQVQWTANRSIQRGTPPPPLADAFVDAHASAPAPELDLDNKGRYKVTFVNPAATPSDQGMPEFFAIPPQTPADDHSERDPEFDLYSFYINNYPIKLQVRGLVVWVVTQGALFKNAVNVVADDSSIPSTLVIVAKANLQDPSGPDRALWFQGGLTVGDNVRVFLVSQSDIALMHVHATGSNQDADDVSLIAAGDVTLQGPDSGSQFSLGHPAAMDALADQLLSRNALPKLSGGAGIAYHIERLSWLETTPR